VVVTEARERVVETSPTVDGGNGYLWEEGPNSFQPNDSMLKCAMQYPCASGRKEREKKNWCKQSFEGRNSKVNRSSPLQPVL